MTEPCTDTPEIDLLTWPVLRSTDIAAAVPTDRSPPPALPTQLKHSTRPTLYRRLVLPIPLYRFLLYDPSHSDPHSTDPRSNESPTLPTPLAHRPPSLRFTGAARLCCFVPRYSAFGRPHEETAARARFIQTLPLIRWLREVFNVFPINWKWAFNVFVCAWWSIQLFVVYKCL